MFAKNNADFTNKQAVTYNIHLLEMANDRLNSIYISAVT